MENFHRWSTEALAHGIASMDEVDKTRAQFELKLRRGNGMSEFLSEQGEQPALPDMELANIIEGLKPEQRIAEKQRLLSEISDRELVINVINQVNDAEGIEVEELV